MNYTPTEQKLIDAMSAWDIIDCHEHLPPEEERTGTPQDVFTLVSHYTRHDLFSAGMDAESSDTDPWSPDRPTYQSLYNYDLPLRQRWQTLKPYWERIRHGSYARAAILTAQMVYGVDDINDGKHMLSIAPAHPRAMFDLYHLGMPSVRDAIVVGKNLPNVYLNLCWTHIISQVQTCSGIDELIDQVPLNKVLAFGGDYGRPIEKVVGHLHMAREDFARVFGARIDRGTMGLDEALAILKQWFWDNPLALYSRLTV